MSGLIEINKFDENQNKEILMQQVIKDNKNEIIDLLIELNLIDEFNDYKKEKIIELALSILSHNGELCII